VTKKEVFKNLIIVAFLASLIFVLHCLVVGEPYVGMGDYYDQQIAFYKHAHEFVRGGNWLWDWNAELGVEFIPTYAFYLTFSPFFLITLLFPNNWVIYLMPILNVLKVVLANATAILYFKDKFKKKELVFLSAFLYAFCGWMFDSLFFNHFIEVMAIFPLYLWSFDKVIAGEKKGLFCVMTTISLLVNYFFWFGEVVFIALYFLVRVIFDKSYKVTKNGLIRFVIEGLLGVGLTCIVLFPIVNTVFQNPRANAKLGGNLFSYSNLQMYFSIIKSALQFPNPLMWQGDWFKVLEFGCPSQTLYIGGIGVFLIFPFFVKSEKKWLKIFLGLMFVFAIIPILNSSFALFSSTYYARWFYMLTFFLIWASISFLDDFTVNENKKIVTLSIAIIVALYMICCFVGYFLHVRVDEFVYFDNILFSVASFVFTVISFAICITQKDTEKMSRIVMIFAVISTFSFYIYGCWYQNNMATYKNEGYHYIKEILDNEIEDDSEFYRIHNDRYLNTGLLYNKSSVLGYNSIVPASIYDFYTFIGDTREVKSSTIDKNSKILNVFSVKYIYDEKNHEWVENENYLPMGVIFDNLESVYSYDKIVVSEADVAQKLFLDKHVYIKYQDQDKEEILFEKRDNFKVEGIDINVEKFNNKTIYTYTTDRYLTIPGICKTYNKIKVNNLNMVSSQIADCVDGDLFVAKMGDVKIEVEHIIESSVRSARLTNMEFSQYGLKANSNLDRSALVFFTIPYDDLWDAYIDGKKVEIIKGDNAFIVLDIPEGEHSIEFKYNTKYYKYGAIVSGISCLLFIAYMIFDKNKKSGEN